MTLKELLDKIEVKHIKTGKTLQLFEAFHSDGIYFKDKEGKIYESIWSDTLEFTIKQ